MIRFDGFYATEEVADEVIHDEQDDCWSRHYLRFYPDGFVVAAWVTGAPVQVVAWLGKSNPNCTQATYSVENNRVSFTIHVKTPEGELEVGGTYQGKIETDSLTLTSHDRLNQFIATHTYSFIGGLLLTQD